MSKHLHEGSFLGLSEVKTSALWKMLVAEFLGTLILVLIGCGSIVFNKSNDPPVDDVSVLIRIALTFGLTLATLVQCIGHVSGCHVNPAVSLSLMLTGDIKVIRGVLFMLVQCIGGIVGSTVLKMLLPEAFPLTSNGTPNVGITHVSKNFTQSQGVAMELILTFLLVFVIYSVCDGNRKDLKGSPALAIGLTLAVAHLSGIPVTGASLNPARSFGPAVIGEDFTDLWVYWAGPLIGGPLAGILYTLIFKSRKGDDSYDL